MQYADRTKRIGQTIFIQDTHSGCTTNDLIWPQVTSLDLTSVVHFSNRMLYFWYPNAKVILLNRKWLRFKIGKETIGREIVSTLYPGV